LSIELNIRFHEGKQVRNKNVRNSINYFLKKSLAVDKA